MADDERDVLAAARAGRTGVRGAMTSVERALASPSTNRESEWAANLRTALEALQEAWRHHAAVTESDEGLFVDIMSQAPRLAHQVAHLRDEHPAVATSLADVIELIGDPAAVDAGGVAKATDAVLPVIGTIVRHRHAGAGLVYEAYNVDIEAGD